MKYSDRTFRFLVPAAHIVSSDAVTLDLPGGSWALLELDELPSSDAGLRYICVSYAWGPTRVFNPFNPTTPMSDRTWAALTTAIGDAPPAAIWIDALCVPSEAPHRTLTLRRLGLIYSRAAEVAVVLSAACRPALEKIQKREPLDPAALLALEEDEWVSRAWTYQELVNSNKVRFTVEGRGAICVLASELLNSVGVAVEEYKKALGYDSAAMRANNPRLDALVDCLADWMINRSFERSAYSVLAMMAVRRAECDQDYFHAMLGTISQIEPEDSDTPEAHPSEEFMRACEAKADFSFIYSSNTRMQESGRHWRPVAGALRAILPWHSWGPGQPGTLHASHLRLNQLYQLYPGEAAPDARDFVERWLKVEAAELTSQELQTAAFERLRGWGFTGAGDCLELTGGYFYSQDRLPSASDIVALVATQVRWLHGAPGVLVQAGPGGMYRFLGVGAFVGRVPDGGESFRLD